MKNFFITLPSNASMDIYKENKTSQYTVKLPNKLQLQNFKVGLSEIHIPNNLLNVTEENNSVFITFEEVVMVTVKIETKLYNKITDIIDEINNKLLSSHFLFNKNNSNLLSYNEKNNFVNVHKVLLKLRNIGTESKDKSKIFYYSRGLLSDFLKLTVSKILLENRLSIQLGFPCETNILELEKASFPSQINFGIPNQLFIYCDIVDYQLIGDKYAKIIKILTIDYEKLGNFGSTFSKEITPVQYLPISENYIDEITIHIKDAQGKNIPFLYGTLIAQLHFIED